MTNDKAPVSQSAPSAEESKWIAKMQKLLNQCPPNLGFYTIGDPCLMVYDNRKEGAINEIIDSGRGTDFCVAVDKLNAGVGQLYFTSHVHSTAG